MEKGNLTFGIHQEESQIDVSDEFFHSIMWRDNAVEDLVVSGERFICFRIEIRNGETDLPSVIKYIVDGNECHG